MLGIIAAIVLSGICVLSSRLPHQYHFVKDPKNWTEAQRYCREKYTDLATIDNMEDMNKLIETMDSDSVAWIGLYDDLKSWRWSLSDEGYYGEGEAEFRSWGRGEPNNLHANEYCAEIRYNGVWNDISCSKKESFICYNGTAVNSSLGFVFVKKRMNWTDAQRYCREHYIDMASVRNQAENQEIQGMMGGKGWAWIGLFRDSWKWWSDGSDSSFKYWKRKDGAEPNNVLGNESCVAAWSNYRGRWTDWPCTWNHPFVCHSSAVEKLMLRLKLTPKDSPVDLNNSTVLEDVLKQLKQKLKEEGVTGDIKLSWKKQPDGRVFHNEEEKKKEKKGKKKKEKSEL